MTDTPATNASTVRRDAEDALQHVHWSHRRAEMLLANIRHNRIDSARADIAAMILEADAIADRYRALLGQLSPEANAS